MAAPPFTKADFKAVIPTANSSLCRKMVLVLIKMPVLLYRLVDYLFEDDMTLSTDVKGGVGGTTGALAAPTGVDASNGTYIDKVTVTWNPVSGSTHYHVFRGPTSQFSAANQTPVGVVTVQTFDDNTAEDDVTYFYFVKAINATETSAVSLADAGFSDSTGGGGVGAAGQIIKNSGDSWVVPPGVTTVQAELWAGGGGGGGAGYLGFLIPSLTVYAGGGGGAGEYLKVLTIPVTPGQVLEISGGTLGTGGVSAQNGGGVPSAGAPGGDIRIVRSTIVLATAKGGGGGQAGWTGGDGTGQGGTGGTGGTASVGVVDTQTAGATGSNGGSSPLSGSATGGAGAAENTGGGNGGGAGGSWANFGQGNNGANGGIGKVRLVWPSP